MSGCYRVITSDRGFYLEAISAFGWRSWANPGGTQPLPPVTVPKPAAFSPMAAQHKPFSLRTAQPLPAVTKITQATSHHQNPPVSPRLIREGNS